MQILLTVSVICYLIVISVCEKDDHTLTTATERGSTSDAQPSTVDRRIKVEQVPTKKPSTSLNLFQLTNPKTRRRSEIWSWDYWCQLQPKIGNCTEYSERYYYDAPLDMCMKFTYSGCQGNKNKFHNLVECEQHCVGAVYMPVKETSPSAFCLLQKSGGLCLALFPQYYYDINERKCKYFTYGGCGGNQNRFDTISNCQDVCQSGDPESGHDDSDVYV